MGATLASNIEKPSSSHRKLPSPEPGRVSSAVPVTCHATFILTSRLDLCSRTAPTAESEEDLVNLGQCSPTFSDVPWESMEYHHDVKFLLGPSFPETAD